MPASTRGVYAIKVHIADAQADVFEFADQKTMYGGKHIAAGDTVYLLDSETSGGAGLLAKGIVLRATSTPRQPGIERQTPRVSVSVRRTSTATRALGRSALKPHADWSDGRPQTELNFKLYRQATDKIVGLSAEAAAFLDALF